ncbi:MAG: TlpA family protein disulfide reductase [Chloroflexi bacterium]|nr:TlpA family protein disulfide reductase [Chloroflexota bacterium]
MRTAQRKRAARAVLFGGGFLAMLLTVVGVARWEGFDLVTWWGDARAASEAHGPAPEFQLDTFAGERIQLADFRGKPLVLNFWASWCVPCRAEMPYFERTFETYRAWGVTFVGFAVEDDPGAARDFLRELGVTYPAGIDYRNETAVRYRLTGLPTTIFIGADGNIFRTINGPVTEQELIALLTRLVV